MSLPRKLMGLLVLGAVWAPMPAVALVEDPLSLLGAPMDQALDTGMKNINADKLEVVILRTLPDDADGLAAAQFLEHHLGPDAGVIMVGLETHSFGSYLGTGYAQHGVTAALVRKLGRRVFVPAAKQGDPSEGLLALVREIKLARTLGRDPDVAPASKPVQGWLPWWWYLPPVVLLVIGLATRWGLKRRRSLRRRARLQGLVDRLEDLQIELQRMAPAWDQLAGAGRQGTPDAALEANDRDRHAELAAVKQRVATCQADLKAGDWEATERALADAEARLFPLAVNLAGALAAHRARLSGQSGPQILERTRHVLARWQRLSDARARWAEATAESGSGGPQQLAERLQALGKLLTRAPLDVAGAEEFLDGTEAVYGRALEAASGSI